MDAQYRAAYDGRRPVWPVRTGFWLRPRQRQERTYRQPL